MPRLQTNTSPLKRKAAKPASRGTPVRNSFLLILFAAALAAMVILLPSEPTRRAATMMAPGAEGAVGSGVAEELPLRISEVMSSNRSAYPDDRGNYPDWIEVENTSQDPVDLSGIGLSDRDDRVLFIFPSITLNGGGRVVVFCDDLNIADADKPLHARFKISSLGESIYLYGRDSIILNSVTVPALNADVSYALTESGWIMTEQCTPGYPNTEAGYTALRSAAVSSATGLVLSELLASNRTVGSDEDGEYSDWIELYNGGSLPIDLSNYALSDDEADPIKWRFPQGAVIHPGEYYVVFASGKDRPGGGDARPHTSFKLAAEGETVILSDIMRQTLDRVTFENLDTDVSWGRMDGMSGTWTKFNQPTPGYANNRTGEIEMDARMRSSNASGIYISEVMTSSTGVETPYGVTSYDWIELVNRTTEEINLRGWGLSDKTSRPRKWQFPDVTIRPGEYLMVFPSGLTESQTGSGATHATFRLSALGETVVLSGPNGNVVDKLVVPKLEVDTSYGRDFDRGGLFYYDVPTAGAKNTEQGFSGYAQKPAIEMAGGIYERPVQVTLSAPEGVEIRYTLDGSEPTEQIGEIYTGPIDIKRATALRARGFVKGLKPSEVVTESFLVNVYHILPVVSLTVDPDDLWNPLTGIYAEGDNGETYEKVPFKKTTYRIVKNDPALKERAGNFEYFTPEGAQLLNQGVAVQLHGQFSLDIAQKSFRITAKSKYGKDTLAYSFFSDRSYEEYPAIILRNGGNDGSYSRIVDTMQSRIVDWTGVDLIHMAGESVIVYLNGDYWGQYDIRERINTRYIAMYEGWTDPDNIDFIKGDNSVLNGSSTNYKSLLEYVRKHDLNDPAALKTVTVWVDIDNYFDFMIFEIYFGNSDPGNIKFYRQRANGAKWRWVLFDLDWGYWMRINNGCSIWLNPQGAGAQRMENVLIRKLLEVPEMLDKFLTRFGYLYQTYLTDSERIIALVDELVETIEPEMGLHFNLWAGQTKKTVASDPPSDPIGALNYWKSRTTRLKNIVNARPYYVWGYVQDWFKLSDAEMTAYFGPRPEETEDIY